MLELLITWPSFLGFALLAGLGIAFAAAPLGVFMVWQKQSYFGATIAHSALLGVSLGLFFQINLTLSVLLLALTVALFIHLLQGRLKLSNDTLLGILAHATLGLGLVLLSLQQAPQFDLMSYLFGDLLSVNQTDLWLIAGLVLLTVLFFKWAWHPLIQITLNKDLAQVEGIAVKPIQMLYILLLALMIALAMKMIGVLLITSLLIIPAATARKFSQTPETMLKLSLLFGLLSVVAGLLLSFQWDLPSGPAIVLAATFFFLLSFFKAGKHS